MITPPVQRPIGFAPWEISALVNSEVIAEHAEESAFLWTMRDQAVGAPQYALKDLAALDDRVDAHLAGLRIAGEAGWIACEANLEHLGPGEVFALSVLAFVDSDRRRMTEALHAACTSRATSRGLIAALGWLAFDRVSPWITRLLEATSATHRAIGIRAAAVHRRDPGEHLAAALTDPDPDLRASALRALGELKRRDQLDRAYGALGGDHEAGRFWAAWALTLNGDSRGVLELAKWFGREDVYGMRALHLGLRAMPVDQSREQVSVLARSAALNRQAVIGAGIVGDPTSIPWLIRKMDSPELARLAGEAFTTITGVDLIYHDLVTRPAASGSGE